MSRDLAALAHLWDDAVRPGRHDAGRPDQPGLPTQVVLGALLTAVVGFVDAIGYIGLGGLFASFMSGASVSLGVGLGDGEWGPVFQGATMIASFLGGVTLGTVLTGATGAWALPAVLFLEALLLAGAALLAGDGWTVATAILPVVAAMGVQNTVLQPVGGVRLGVTFITGTLVSLGRLLGQALLGRVEPWRLGGHVLLWSVLVAGAAAGATLHAAFGPLALTVPAVLVALLAFLGAVPVLTRTQPRQSRSQGFRRHVLPVKAGGPDGTGRRHGDPEPNHPSACPRD